MKLPPKIKKILLVCGISIIYLVFHFIGLDKFTIVWEDETWYANVAYNFSEGNGFANTNVGAFGGDDLFFFTFILGISYKLFGVSIFISRLVSVIIGLMTLVGFYSIMNLYKINKRSILLILLLVVFSNVTYIAFRTVRPDGMIIMLGIWSLFFLLKTINNSKPIYYFLTGLLTSLAFLSHPDGGIFGLLFGVFFSIKSIKDADIKPFLIYFLGTLPVFIVLYINIIYFREQTLSEFLSLWHERTSVSSNENFFIQRLNILTDFYKNYTLGLKRIYIFIFEISLLLIGLFFYNKNRTIFIFSAFGLSMCIIHTLIYSRLYTRSFGEITLFSFLILALMLRDLQLKKTPYLILIILSVIYLGNNIAGDIYALSRNITNTSYSELDQQIDCYVDDDKTVLTLLSLWFPLKNNENYNRYTRWSKTKYSNLDSFLEANEMDYIVISNYLTTGETQTSGRSISNPRRNKKLIFYQKTINHARQNGTLIKQIPTKGYSTVEIWKIDKPTTP